MTISRAHLEEMKRVSREQAKRDEAMELMETQLLELKSTMDALQKEIDEQDMYLEILASGGPIQSRTFIDRDYTQRTREH